MVDAGKKPVNEQLQRKLFRLQEIAPPSAMAQDILKVVTNESADLEQVAAVIEKQPELTARILRCANSAYYGQRGHIFSVAEAIIRVLGLSVTKALSLSLALESSFKIRNCPGFKEEHYWFSAVLTANLARQLAPRLLLSPRPEPGAAYTAGLMCNIGLLALVELYPKEMSQVFAEADPAAETQRMQELLGMDSAQAGEFLGRRWGLPVPLVDAIAHCRDRGHVNLDSPLAYLVRVAVAVADRLIHGGGIMDLPKEFYAGGLERSDIEAAIALIVEDFENMRGMAQLLSGGQK